MTFVSAMLPRRLLLTLLLPLLVIAALASGLIYHRIAASMNNQKSTFMPDSGRIELWKAGIQMIREHPWFGVGPVSGSQSNFRGCTMVRICPISTTVI